MNTTTPDSLSRRVLLQRTLAVTAAGAASGLLGACASPGATAGNATSPAARQHGYRTNLVNVQPSRFKDRDALAVELTEAAQKALLAPGAAGNGPSFAMPDAAFANGVIEVDLAARVNGKGQPEARGFVGLAFHIADDLSTFDAVYLLGFGPRIVHAAREALRVDDDEPGFLRNRIKPAHRPLSDQVIAQPPRDLARQSAARRSHASRVGERFQERHRTSGQLRQGHPLDLLGRLVAHLAPGDHQP